MSVDASYRTISASGREEIRVRGSRFIATILPVRSRDEASAAIADLRREFWDATHNTYAWRIAPDGLEYRFSDDGEPGGTAGKPILFALGQHQLVNVLLVVTRYFGGTKLGAGGLARAYGAAATAAISASSIIEVHDTTRLRLMVPYEDIRTIRTLVEEYALRFDEEFGDVVTYTLDIRTDVTTIFTGLIVDASGGRVGIFPVTGAATN